VDTLGTILYALGRYEEATTAFDEALALSLNLGNSNYHKACLLRREGKKRDAGLYYHRYLLLDGPASPHAEAARRALRDMGDGPAAGS
jgi:tetratricopeptide (TPR) repeat protein